MIPASVSHTNAEGSDPRLPKDVQEQRPMSDQKSPANTLVTEDNENMAVFCKRKDGTKAKVNGLEDVEDKEVRDDGTTVDPNNAFDINTTPRLPEGYSQLCITHPAYATPLLSVSARKEQLTGIVARWSHAENLKLLRAIPTPPVSKELYHAAFSPIPFPQKQSSTFSVSSEGKNSMTFKAKR